jgi:histidinol phosphatase-like PHP family hydrolase
MKRAVKYRAITFLISSLFLLNSYSQADQKYIRLKTGIHFDSKVSGGSYTIAELASIANSYGLDAIIITDHDNMKVTYGISPFQNFLKFSIEENSISKYGIENYLQEIEQISKVYPDIIFIPGVDPLT